MKVKQFIEKLQKADQDKEMYLDDGRSLNVVEIRTVYEDNGSYIVVVSPSNLDQDDLPKNVEIL